jgi:signal transduction histidine kinase
MVKTQDDSGRTLRLSGVRGYGAAMLLSLAALFVTVALWPYTVPSVSPPFFVAVVLSAWFGGTGAGLLATGLAVAGTAYFLISPTYSLALNPVEVLSLGVFGSLALLVSSLTAARRRAEDEREAMFAREQAARAQAESANRAKDEFLAAVSHDLRTPLNAILGWSQLLKSAPPDEETLRSGLAAIERSARLQTQLIEDLLDISRIEKGKLRLDLQPVDLADVVATAVEAMRPTADANGVSLDARLERDTAGLIGDADRLSQVVGNLLSNAVKFTPAGGRVSVELAAGDSECRLAVVDTGIGIAPSFLPHVFDRFRQADGTALSRKGGLGLGLAIVRHLVELHGGSVRAESRGEGTGATFVVTLPLRADAAPENTRAAAAVEGALEGARPAL